MANENVEDTKRLVLAITDFLREQLVIRTDLTPEDIDSLQTAIECLEIAYDLKGNGNIQLRNSRPLLDIFSQVTNPVSVKDKIQADAHKEEGNNYMRRNMFKNAEVEYTSAIELDKWNSIYYCNRAGARTQQENFFHALADCRQAIILNPDYAKAHARMGQAYALLHRPREAARCFRKASQLEPENEKYRNNATAAESEIDASDISQFITSLLGSLIGIGPQDTEDRDSRLIPPPSFMIITESHPPIPGTSSEIDRRAQNGKRSQISESAPLNQINTQEHQSSTTAYNGINNIMFPPLFGVIDEGSEEQPLLEFELSTGNEPTENENDDRFNERTIPIATLELTIIREILSSEDEDGLQGTEKADTKAAIISRNDIRGKETLLPHTAEMESNDQENADEIHNNIPEEKNTNKNTQQNTIIHHETQLSGKQNSNKSEKNSEHALTGEVKDAEEEKYQNDFTSEKDKKQNNDLDKETLPETEAKQIAVENTDVAQDTFHEKLMSDTTTKDKISNDEEQLSDKPNNNLSEKNPAQVSTGKIKDEKRQEDEMRQSAFTSVKDSKPNKESIEDTSNSDSKKD